MRFTGLPLRRTSMFDLVMVKRIKFLSSRRLGAVLSKFLYSGRRSVWDVYSTRVGGKGHVLMTVEYSLREWRFSLGW